MLVTVEHGSHQGATYPFTDEQLIIGRDPSCDVVLADEQVSTRHAAIARSRNGALSVLDLGSTNGTFVDGERIREQVLRGDEQITVGKSILRVYPASDGRTVLGSSSNGLGDRGLELSDRPRPANSPDSIRDIAPEHTSSAEEPHAAERTRPTPSGRPRVLRTAAAAALAAVLAVAALLVIPLLGGSTNAHARVRHTLGLQQLIAQASPSVVRVVGKHAGGSGFVIDAKQQLVLTNAHVAVGGFAGDPVNSGLVVQVGNNPSTQTPARVVAASPADDLAVIKLVDPVPGLRALPLGNSDSVHPGDQVIALGFPASGLGTGTPTGQPSTVNSNTGIVTAAQGQLHADPSLPDYQDVIQHQAPINPGNSGGPLLNSDGQVVGINSLSGLPGTQGQYYSIAINYAKRLVPDLEAGRSHSLMGWSLIAMSYQDPDLENQLEGYFDVEGIQNASALASATAEFLQEHQISGVFDTGGDIPANGSDPGEPGPGDLAGSPADKAGTAGFLIDGINGAPVSSVQDVYDALNSAAPGQRLSLHAYNIDNPSLAPSVQLAAENEGPVYRLELTEPLS